jgi:GNAT superfamily N-acetyltransferase
VADLYGQADPKYRRDDVLSHLFTQSPAGPALHSFALDDGRAVGHCAVVPMRARRGPDELRCGKLEALWIEESHRGRTAGEEPLYRTLLDRLYAFADERGFELIHGHATPRIGRVIRFVPVEGVGKPSWVSVVAPGERALKLLAGAQRGLRELARAFSRPKARAALRPANAEDADLLEAPSPPPGRWTAVLGDAWEWYRSSPLVRVLDIPGEHGCRALIQVPATPFEPVRIVGWRSEHPGLRAAALVLAAAGRVARQAGAPTLRFQPWPSEAGDGALQRACRLLGLVRRDDQTTLWVRTHDPRLARPETIVPSPLFYLAF